MYAVSAVYAVLIEEDRMATQPSALRPFRVGAGSGFAGDRYEPAVALAAASVDALVFECLAERTIALAHRRLRAGEPGFDSRILRRIETVLPALASNTKIITNAGAADPVGAARAIADLMRDAGRKVSVAAVTGDDLVDRLPAGLKVMETGGSIDDFAGRIVSANAYLGAAGIMEALGAGADIVVTGRVGDASLFVAPILHHFGWTLENLDAVATGTLVGHLLECAGQLTGGYFADARRSMVPDLAHLGFPFADVHADGRIVLGKPAGTGGALTERTVLQQLLYEIEDPRKYLTPDAAVDLTGVSIRAIAENVVEVSGPRADAAPPTLKASIGVDDGYLATAEISYAGEDCLERAEIAAQIIRDRWSAVFGYDTSDLRIDMVGRNATRPWFVVDGRSAEVRLRVTVRTDDRQVAETLAEEVEALYTNGPGGGGGATSSIEETVGIVSVLVDRELVRSRVEFVG
jgi:hypothetical protein